MDFKTGDLADGMSVVRSLARKCGLRLVSSRPRAADGTRRRVYQLDPVQVQEMVEKTAAYRARIKDPSAAKALVTTMGPSAEVQAIVAGILDEAA